MIQWAFKLNEVSFTDSQGIATLKQAGAGTSVLGFAGNRVSARQFLSMVLKWEDHHYF